MMLSKIQQRGGGILLLVVVVVVVVGRIGWIRRHTGAGSATPTPHD